MKKFAKLSLISVLSMAFALPVAAKTAPKAAPVAAKAESKAAPAKNDKSVKVAKTESKTPQVRTAKIEPVSVAQKKEAKAVAAAPAKSKLDPKQVVKAVIKTKQPQTVADKVADKKTADKKSAKELVASKAAATKPAAKTVAKAPERNVVKTSYKLPTKVVPAEPVVEVKREIERPKPVAKVVTPPTPKVYGSVAKQYGLNEVFDPVGLRASVALVVDQNSWTTLYEKNVSTPLPIASITKLMTAMVVLDAKLDLNEYITITDEDAAHYRSSRLSVGTSLPRRDVMLLALMSSENRAAYALGRTYPGGIDAFVSAMNAKAMMLGMSSAQFVDPSGLSSSNRASAMDLAKMVNAATQYKTIRELSTNDSAYVYTANGRYNKFVNSNRLISRNMGWDIGLQKTGTLSAAGKCLVLQTRINGTPKIMVFLDSKSADSRVADAMKLKSWVEMGSTSRAAAQPFGGFTGS